MLDWFNQKIKSEYLEIDLLTKNQYERKHPIEKMINVLKIKINWLKDKCVNCKMLLKTDLLGCDVPNSEMSYSNFFI